jgi:protein transport protein SEC31
MKINEIHRAAALTWCPCTEHTDIIATGSIAGSLEDFSSGSKIELFATDLNSTQAKLLGSASTPDRFNKLSWGNPVSETFPYGILAGAMVDGTIGIWNPEKMLNEETSKDSLLTTLDKHKGSVRGLSFNKLQPNLLASAGEDSMMYIWNLQKPEAPVGYTIPGNNPHANQVISNLGWNQKFDYVLLFLF